VNFFYVVPLLFSCVHRDVETIPDSPVELISCDSPKNLQEAELNVEDNREWSKVGFAVTQGDNAWDTNLVPSGDGIWEIQMRLIELECVEDFNYEIHYFNGD
jgi:hypothetical protein